jgi:hypothetical protein
MLPIVKMVLLVEGVKLVRLMLSEKKLIEVGCLHGSGNCRTFCEEAVLQTTFVVPMPGWPPGHFYVYFLVTIK